MFPLWQQTYVRNTPSSDYGVITTISSMHEFVGIFGFIELANGNVTMAGSLGDYTIYRGNGTNNIIYHTHTSYTGFYNRPCSLTVLYTKTE